MEQRQAIKIQRYYKMKALNDIVARYKRIRNLQYVNKTYHNQFAFVGIGNHATQNLYPVLSYLNLPLKYIVCSSQSKAKTISDHYFPTIGTDNIDTVLEDDEIKGVFICINGDKHFDIVTRCLAKNKNVFVEKPPCRSMEQLQILIEAEAKNKNLITCVGMQKRYAPLTHKLIKLLNRKSLISYSYRYVTGAYIEGDSLTDLFIHPIDYVTFLFGNAEICSLEIINGGHPFVQTLFITLKHKNIFGQMELSTAYSWTDVTENLIINTKEGVFEAKNFCNLTFQPKQNLFYGIPTEKIFNNIPPCKTVFTTNDFNPILQNNQIYYNGYFSELKNFILAVESGKNTSQSSFSSLKNTYTIIEQIKNAKQDIKL